MPTFKSMAAGYRNLWATATVTKVQTVRQVATSIMNTRKRYEEVGQSTGVPWFWIACVHHRESGRDFRGVLHNGQKIIGTGRKTTIVPKGRGPFTSWEGAAVDALTHKSHALHKVDEWSIEQMLYEFERWNGWGYNGRINSPYVWAATNHQQRGKYVRDGKFDRSVMDQQLGCAAILKMLASMDVEIEKAISAPAKPISPKTPPEDRPGSTKPHKKTLGIGAVIAALLALAWAFAEPWVDWLVQLFR